MINVRLIMARSEHDESFHNYRMQICMRLPTSDMKNSNCLQKLGFFAIFEKPFFIITKLTCIHILNGFRMFFFISLYLDLDPD
jgi:hypothetical protein